MKDKVIGSRKLKGASKSPWECGIRKRAKDVQEQIGQGYPRRNKWDKGTHKQCNKKSLK